MIMGFAKKTDAAVTFAERTRFDLSNKSDRDTIKDFELSIDECDKRNLVIPGTIATEQNTLSGISLYLHEAGLYVFTKRYPIGAIRDTDGYRVAQMKWSALQELRGKRAYAREHEVEAMKNRSEDTRRMGA